MFKIFIVSFCFMYVVKTDNLHDKVTIDKEHFENLVQRLTNIERFAKEQSNLVIKLQEEIHELKATGRSQALVTDNQGTKIKELTSICAKKSDIKGKVRRQSSDTVVAFSATIKQQHVDNIGSHQNIVFSDVITNIGNGYNNHHGVFIAPASGLYMFMATLLSSQNAELAAAIEINGTDIVRMFEKGADNRHGSASQTVIVALRKGDDVAIQSVFPDGHSYWGDRYTSFSGVLLREMEMDASQIFGRK